MNSQFLEYGSLDAACMVQARDAFWPDLATGGFQPAYDMTIDLLPVLSFMQTRGILVNMEALKITQLEILESAATKQEELNRLCGRELNVNSPKDCQIYFYVEMGIPPYYNEGSVTVDDLALQRLSRGTAKRPGLRQAKLVQEIRGLAKLNGTYLDLEFDADGRMRCSYNPRGCLLPDTEVLTKDGWTTLENFRQGQEALQWSPTGDLTWGVPNKVVYDVEETLIECASEQHECVYTNDHRIPSYVPNTSRMEVRTAQQTAATYRQLPVSGKLQDSEAKNLQNLIRVIVMIQADGCISEGNIILNFKKESKATRCVELLDNAGLSYTTPQGNLGYYRFSIRRIDSAHIIGLIGKSKLYDSWLLQLDQETLLAFIDEIQYWDADARQNHVRYNTIHKVNADWVATVAHLCGKKAYTTYRPEGYSPIWRVTITDQSRVSLKSPYWRPYRYKGKVYCLETSTEFFLARYKNHIFVTGNTKFGRLSSSKTIFGTGTNFQNLPQEFKKFLVADPGYVFWEVDKRLAEWVVVAYLANDANMIRVIEEGLDVHSHTASLMFGVDIEVVQYENKLVGQNTDPDIIQEIRASDEILTKYCGNFPRSMSARQCGKKSDHGLNYDEGPNKFALINEIEQSEAGRIVSMYHNIYPGIRSTFHEGVRRQLTRDRSLTNCFGRKVRFMGQWDSDLWKSAYSMLPQSSVVDSLNQGMIKSYNDPELCSSDKLNIDILAQVHDSLLLQVPISVVNNLSIFNSIKDKIFRYVSPELSYNGRVFTIATDMKLGLNWGGYDKNTNLAGMREIKDINNVSSVLEELKC